MQAPGLLLLETESMEDDMGTWAIQRLLHSAHTLRLHLKDHIKDVDVGARQMRNLHRTVRERVQSPLFNVFFVFEPEKRTTLAGLLAIYCCTQRSKYRV